MYGLGASICPIWLISGTCVCVSRAHLKPSDCNAVICFTQQLGGYRFVTCIVTGLSRPLVGKDGLVQVGNAVGTISYTAPETFTENVLQKPSDVFAFGILSKLSSIILTALWPNCTCCLSLFLLLLALMPQSYETCGHITACT